MLVLTRKLQQQIKIGDQITVTILRVKGNTVRIGIEAPRAVRVIRGELPKSGGDTVTADQVEDAGSGAAAPAEATVAATPTAIVPPLPLGPSAAHLPLRRIHNRHGSAPLKQVVASCASLAK